MAKFFLMGNFTEKAFAGFLKDPGSDRSDAAKKCSESVGAEMKSYTYLRGPYDFIVETHGTFEQMAAIKWLLREVVHLKISLFVRKHQ